jgi:hypothetical protein
VEIITKDMKERRTADVNEALFTQALFFFTEAVFYYNDFMMS